MNILSKLLFTLSFLLFASSHSELCGMKKMTNAPFMTNNHVVVEINKTDGYDIRKYYQPKTKLLGAYMDTTYL